LKNHIPEQTIEEIRSRADIVEVISDFVPLKLSGKNHKGLCPFHSEKTPSFTANQEKQIYHCFGCGAGGNVFRFLMEIDDLSFVDAVKKLAQRYNVVIPQTGHRGSETGTPSERESLLGINRKSAEFFAARLKEPAGKAARDYIYSRGFDDRVIEHCQIGWAPAGWRNLLTHLETRAKCPRKKLEKFGLVSRKESQKANESDVYYDRFRERIIFPIQDPQGNIIGFGGRILGQGEPKYLNTPETLAYKKGNNLYGLHAAKESIRKKKQVLVVEGYFDQIRAWQHGIENTVATCGTAMTARQATLLKQHTDTVILIFDADMAGQTAAERGYQVLAEQGLKVHVVPLPAGHDPDSLIREEGPEAFLSRVETAPPFLRYFVQRVAQGQKLSTTEGKLEAINKVLPVLTQVKNIVERSEYAQYTAEVFGIQETALREEMKKALAQNQKRVHVAPVQKPRAKHDAEYYLIHLMLSDETVARDIRRQVSADMFRTEAYRQTAENIFEWIDQGEPLRVDRLLDRINQPEVKEVLTKISIAPLVFDNIGKAVTECLIQLKKQSIQTEINSLKQQRNEAEKAGQTEKSRELHAQVNKMRLSLIPE